MEIKSKDDGKSVMMMTISLVILLKTTGEETDGQQWLPTLFARVDEVADGFFCFFFCCLLNEKLWLKVLLGNIYFYTL